ncbi:MAG: hypothetical protein JNL70_16460 [Saprospiraceae bacterium]|nr:hypothetical protein [Saprospiraceae bacterium]
MLKNPVIIFLLFLIIGCQQTVKTTNDNTTTHYVTKTYVEVGRLFDSITPPYIIDLTNGNKRLVFVGCEHQLPDTHRQFKIIEQYFNELNPQITFNEGGQWADSIKFASKKAAILRGGEAAFLKYLSDSIGIKMMNGDMTEKEEFALTSRYHTQEEWYLYYMIERIVIPYHYETGRKASIDSVFSKTTRGYFAKHGFKMTPEQYSFEHFKKVYEKYLKKPFDINNFDIEAFDYVNDNCHFCAIGRTSKMVRDSVLLSKIDKAFNQYDRIMVTFGHGHALAVEPALKSIIYKPRD